jgi:hypothetical protein
VPHNRSVPTSPPVRSVRFEVRPWGSGPLVARELLPYVDDVSMVDLVRGYELAAGYEVPGAYAGIVLDHFNFGDLTSYLTGAPESPYCADLGVVALLGCDCGEVGCWPLETRVVVQDGLVTWQGFVQPFRRGRDYSTFGPFVFQQGRYERAVREAAAVASMLDEPGQMPHR